MPRATDIFRARPSRMLAATMLLIASDALPVLAQDTSAPRRFDIVLKNGRVAGGPRVLQVVRGDRVDILWTSDREVALHLHGYDIESTAAPGSPRHMAFTAYATGRFPVEIHGGSGQGGTLIYVEVHPR